MLVGLKHDLYLPSSIISCSWLGARARGRIGPQISPTTVPMLVHRSARPQSPRAPSSTSRLPREHAPLLASPCRRQPLPLLNARTRPAVPPLAAGLPHVPDAPLRPASTPWPVRSKIRPPPAMAPALGLLAHDARPDVHRHRTHDLAWSWTCWTKT
jgi:hypothetical protein